MRAEVQGESRGEGGGRIPPSEEVAECRRAMIDREPSPSSAARWAGIRPMTGHSAPQEALRYHKYGYGRGHRVHETTTTCSAGLQCPVHTMQASQLPGGRDGELGQMMIDMPNEWRSWRCSRQPGATAVAFASERATVHRGPRRDAWPDRAAQVFNVKAPAEAKVCRAWTRESSPSGRQPQAASVPVDELPEWARARASAPDST